MKQKVTLVGAGLAGSLFAVLLARRGHDVTICERRPDPRKGPVGRSRSINLALSTRGIHALSQVGLDRAVLDLAIPMRGRMIHALGARSLSSRTEPRPTTSSTPSRARHSTRCWSRRPRLCRT